LGLLFAILPGGLPSPIADAQKTHCADDAPGNAIGDDDDEIILVKTINDPAGNSNEQCDDHQM
jgi:hypothetical protein